MGEKNEISVKSCGVHFVDDSPVFHKTLVFIKGTVRKMLGDKVLSEKNIGYTVDLEGVKVCEVLEPFASSIRIKVATMRDQTLVDFNKTADELNGSTVKLADLLEMVQKEGSKRQPMLVKWLLSTGKFSDEQARAIYDDPARREKAQQMFDRLMKQASVDDL